MKFSATQFFAVLSLASSAAADFHVLTGPCSIAPGWSGSLSDATMACPSNYYNCNCLLDGDRAGHVISEETPTVGITTTGSDYFKLDGMCGVGNMNFYLQDDGTWLFYISGGDGSVQGTCYNEDNSIKDCNGFSAACSFSNILVCYSYICN